MDTITVFITFIGTVFGGTLLPIYLKCKGLWEIVTATVMGALFVGMISILIFLGIQWFWCSCGR